VPSKYFEHVRDASRNATSLDQYLSRCEESFSDLFGSVEFKIADFDKKSNSLNFLARSFDTLTPGLSGKISDPQNPFLKAVIENTSLHLTSADLISRAFKENSKIWFEELLMEQLWVTPLNHVSVLVGYTDTVTRLTENEKEVLVEILELRPTLLDMKKHQEAQTKGTQLSERKLQILKLLAEAYSNKEIAKSVEISESAVKHEISDIFHILGVDSRTEAVRFYFNNLLIK
jgi:DNA-binding CsgD family transcriptional regulator